MSSRFFSFSFCAGVVLAGASAFACTAVQAESYFAVLPLADISPKPSPGRVQLALAGLTPPTARVGVPYEFHLGALLTVKGPENIGVDEITWSIAEGVLPAGLALDEDRVVGTPFEATSEAVVTVRAQYSSEAGAAEVSERYAFSVDPVAAFRISNVVASPSSLVADGVATSMLTATVTDTEGRLVGPGVPVSWSTDSGELTDQYLVTNNAGQASATLRAGMAPGTATVRVLVEGGSSSIEVALMEPLAPAECHFTLTEGPASFYAVMDAYNPYAGNEVYAIIRMWGWDGDALNTPEETYSVSPGVPGYTYDSPIPEGSSIGLPIGYRRGRLMVSDPTSDPNNAVRGYEICKLY